MPRKPRWPPVPTRHQSGQARVRIKGVDHYLGPWEDPDGGPAVQANLAALLYRLTRPEGARPEPPAVAEVVAVWLAEERPRLGGQRQREVYAEALAPFLEEAGRLPVSEVDARVLRRARERMLEKGWCRTHTNQMVSRVRTVWRWLESEGLVPKGSSEHLRTLAPLRKGQPGMRESKKRGPCTLEEVGLVASHAPLAVGTILWLLWHTGMRPGEACRMKGVEIDTEPETWLYRPARHKRDWAGQQRVVALGPQAQALLSDWGEEYGCEPGQYFFRPPNRGPNTRDHYARNTLAGAVRRAAKKAGVPGFTAYSCRHAFKDRVKRALGLDAARAALGQHSLGVTNDYGVQADLELAARAARLLG